MTDSLSGCSVLVTGGAGFIGSHLVEALAGRGARMTVFDSLRTGRRENLAAVADAVRLVEGDVRDAEAVAAVVREVRPRLVFHLAANPSVPSSVEDPAFDFETSCLGTFRLLDALRLSSDGGCERFVLASTGAVYGEPETTPIAETHPLRPISPYGASKLNAEETTRMFQRVYGVPGVVARMFNAYGPRMGPFVVLDLLRKLRRDPDRLELLGTGRQVRDFTYVSDAVAGLLLLAEQGKPGEAYNIASGEAVSIRELAERIISLSGLAGRTEVACLGRSWTGDAQRWEVALDKVCALGYRARVPLDEGLRRTIERFQTAE